MLHVRIIQTEHTFQPQQLLQSGQMPAFSGEKIKYEEGVKEEEDESEKSAGTRSGSKNESRCKKNNYT